MTEEKKTNGKLLDDSRSKALAKETIEGLRQEASEALSERDDFLGAVFEKSLSGLAIVDMTGRYIDVNPAMCRMFGYSKEEFLSSDATLLHFPEDVKESLDRCGKLRREGGYVPSLRLRSKSGMEILVDGTISPLTIGKKEYALGMFRDVTLKNILFKTLREERDFARRCLDITGAVLMMVNADEAVTMINKKGCELLSLGEGEISGKNWFDSFVPASERERARSIFRKLIAGEITGTEYFEGGVVTGSGETRLIGWRSEALKDSGGHVYAVLSSGEDITGRKRSGNAPGLTKANEANNGGIKEGLRAQEVLDYIIKGTSGSAGSDFLKSLARHFALALKFKYALISEVVGPEKDRARILTVWADGEYASNFEYDLKGTPCSNVLSQDLCAYSGNVQEMFPQDKLLIDMGVKSYIGVPLLDENKKPFGILAALDDKPIERLEESEYILRIFAARAAFELERKRKDEEFKRHEEMLRAILDNSSAVIYIKDADGRFLLVNKGYERLFNLTREELAGKSDYDIFPKDIADRFRQNDMKVLESGKGIEFEEEAVHPDGATHTYISIKFPIMGIRGAICGISTDITERKRIEESLRQSESIMKEAQHLAQFGNWEWDITTNKITWSEEIYRIFGVEPGTPVTYDTFLSAVHTDDREFVKRSVDETLTEKKPYDIDHRIVLPGGAERIVHERAEVSFNSEGTPVRMIGTVQDITERKRTEEELLKADKLESIGVLAAGIAHDFNNLLLGILGNVTLAKNFFKPDDRMAAILGDIERASLRAKNLTRQLLTFSKGGMPIRETTRIEQLVKDSAGLVLRGSNVRCEYAFPGDLWPVEIDEGQISQVINNIILNAQQAMPEGGTISVDASNVSVKEGDRLPLKAGRYVKLSFRDAGAGIPKAILGKVFDPFFTTKQKASGLGLAVSYSIIKKHNGYINVESREGEGAVFHIYLPSPEKEIGARSEERIVKGKGKILVMDDEEMVRDVSGEMLSLLGYEPAFALDGKETLEMFRKAKEEGKPFDAVILDLTIPGGMGGKETLRQLLEIDPGVKAIVSSGYSQDPIMSEYGRFGFSGVIAKPYRVSDFSKIVNQVLGGK